MFRVNNSPDKRGISFISPRSAFEPTALTVFDNVEKPPKWQLMYVHSHAYSQAFKKLNMTGSMIGEDCDPSDAQPSTSQSEYNKETRMIGKSESKVYATLEHPRLGSVDAIGSTFETPQNPGGTKKPLALNMFRSRISDSNSMAASTPKKSNVFVGLFGRISKIFHTPPRTPTTPPLSIVHLTADGLDSVPTGNHNHFNVYYNVVNILEEKPDRLNASQMSPTPRILMTPPTNDYTFKLLQEEAMFTPNKESGTIGIKSVTGKGGDFPKCKKNLATFLNDRDVAKDETMKSIEMVESFDKKAADDKQKSPVDNGADEAHKKMEVPATKQADDAPKKILAHNAFLDRLEAAEKEREMTSTLSAEEGGAVDAITIVDTPSQISSVRTSNPRKGRFFNTIRTSLGRFVNRLRSKPDDGKDSTRDEPLAASDVSSSETVSIGITEKPEDCGEVEFLKAEIRKRCPEKPKFGSWLHLPPEKACEVLIAYLEYKKRPAFVDTKNFRILPLPKSLRKIPEDAASANTPKNGPSTVSGEGDVTGKLEVHAKQDFIRDDQKTPTKPSESAPIKVNMRGATGSMAARQYQVSETLKVLTEMVSDQQAGSGTIFKPTKFDRNALASSAPENDQSVGVQGARIVPFTRSKYHPMDPRWFEEQYPSFFSKKATNNPLKPATTAFPESELNEENRYGKIKRVIPKLSEKTVECQEWTMKEPTDAKEDGSEVS